MASLPIPLPIPCRNLPIPCLYPAGKSAYTLLENLPIPCRKICLYPAGKSAYTLPESAYTLPESAYTFAYTLPESAYTLPIPCLCSILFRNSSFHCYQNIIDDNHTPSGIVIILCRIVIDVFKVI